MSEKHVIGEKRGNIFYLTFNRPEKRNAISFQMLDKINKLVEPVAMDPEIRVIIVRGEGKVFSAGIDFNSLGGLAGAFLGDVGGGGAAIRAEIHRGQQVLNRLESIEVPIICAMHGGVFGLGVDLMTQLDMEVSMQSIMIRSEDFQEGVNALIESRDPRWKRK